MAPFRVMPFTPDNLATIIREKAHGRDPRLERKSQIEYLKEYLGEIGATTIVVEEEYIDHDFWEDFAAYYVRCFEAYPRVCTRLHFFSHGFDEARFRGILLREEPESFLTDSYLGFIVVKPLPTTVIGRTCLRTYPDAGRNRSFPVLWPMPSNLFGIPLTVHTLPFQEQDTDVAACATSALWTVFQATGRLFQHATPSPAEITKYGVAHWRVGDRTIPNRNGLTALQIADAVRSMDLEPHAISIGNSQTGKGTLLTLQLAASAYLRARIPSVLLAMFHRVDGSRQLTSDNRIGGHAVAINGYSLGSGPPTAYGKTGCLFKASKIDRLYCHDDQIGPFARLRLGQDLLLGTSWKSTAAGDVVAFPETLVVPLYHKIRIPISVVMETIIQFDSQLELLRKANVLSLGERLTWDLYLNSNADLRHEVFLSNVPAETRLEFMERNLPRYMWCAEASAGNEKMFRLLFDGTDLLQGKQFLCAIPHDKALCRALAVVGQTPQFSQAARTGTRAVLSWFAENAVKFA